MNEQITSRIESLSEYAESVPTKLKDLSQLMEEFAGVGEAVTSAATEQQQHLSEKLAELNEGLIGNKQQAVEKQAELSTKLEEFSSGFAQWQEEIGAIQNELTTELQEAQSIVTEVRGKIEEGHKRCQTAEEQMTQAWSQVEEQMQAEHDRFESVMAQFKDDYDELSKSLEQLMEEVKTEAGGLSAGIQDARTENQAVAQEALTGFREHHNQFQQGLSNVSHQVIIPAKDNITQELNGRIDREAKELIEEASNQLKDALKELSRKLAGHSSDASGDRSTIENIRNEVEYLITHLDDLAKEIGHKAAKIATFGVLG